MKKTSYILLTLIVFITASGFRGCSTYGDFLEAALKAFNYSLRSGAGGLDADNTILYYGIAVGDSGKVFTLDGRPPAPWIERPTPTTNRLNALGILNNPDSTIAYAVGNRGTVLRSTDRGHSWQNTNPAQNFPNLNGLALQGSTGTRIIAVGDSGTFIRSTNGGGNWLSYPINTTRNLKSVVIDYKGSYIAVGQSGAIYVSYNGGVNWTNYSLADTSTLNKVVGHGIDRLCAVGNNGKIYTSTTFAVSWVLRNSGTTRNLKDVLFSGIDSGVAVGDFGTVRHTTDRGVSWFADSYFNGLTTRNIISIAKVDSNTVNSITTSRFLSDAAADTTFFLAVSSEPFTGIKNETENFPGEFALEQNYPNPFNPNTAIRFSVPTKGYVRIAVYDMLGRYVTTLANEVTEPGTYNVLWDGVDHTGASVSSGVYLYRIEAGAFTASKKMLMLK